MLAWVCPLVTRMRGVNVFRLYKVTMSWDVFSVYLMCLGVDKVVRGEVDTVMQEPPM
jgi:hypothetical protein